MPFFLRRPPSLESLELIEDSVALVDLLDDLERLVELDDLAVLDVLDDRELEDDREYDLDRLRDFLVSRRSFSDSSVACTA